MDNDIFKVHEADARNINNIVKNKIVDVTITSPPYYDVKDYGHEEQIGYGQSYEDYLADLKIVFSNVYDITKDTGSLWVVIDTFRKNNEIVTLPFDFAHKMQEVGWQFRDIIIWNKDKTVPWSREKHTKNKFEYILLFSKTPNFRYEKDKVREYDTRFLKKWWVRYPERYNPKGKAPDEVWNYPIPTQGSWGNSYRRHFCPLPTDMIGRMILLSTSEQDVVLDPFAGSGSVLAQADYMKRKYIGFELNPDYIDQFHKYLSDTESKGKKKYEVLETGKYTQEQFSETILGLRSLKFARTMYKLLDSDAKDAIKIIYVNRLDKKPEKNHKLITAEYKIYYEYENRAEKALLKDTIKEELAELINKPPLSKYGIEPTFSFYVRKTFLSTEKQLYVYDSIKTHKYKEIYSGQEDYVKLKIISPIKMDIDEKDFE